MGHSNSVPVMGRRKSVRTGWRTCLLRRPCHRKGNLSATFNMMPTQTKLDQLNVNTASEEELMTLPGISRTEAHNIVNYRQAIGRFNKVEDLALVTGIGAEKLAVLRPEICVGPSKRTASCASSRAESVDSLLGSTPIIANLSAVDTTPCPPVLRPPTVCVNTASVFDLQTLPGFSQEVAANIVHYRDRHGPFTSLDQLSKVKGVKSSRLNAVRSRLSLHQAAEPVSVKNNSTVTSSQSSQAIPNGKISGHRKTVSAPIKYPPMSNGLAVRDILDVLSACSTRPIINDCFNGVRNGRPALRIASWNLSNLSVEKIENPGVSEVMCRTILENRRESDASKVTILIDSCLHEISQSPAYKFSAVLGTADCLLGSHSLVDGYRQDPKKIATSGASDSSIVSDGAKSRFSLIAVQGVLEVKALRKLCEELNRPTLRRVKDWKENSHSWKMQISTGPADEACRGLGFIWDSSSSIKLFATTELRLRDVDTANAEALLADFKLGPVSVTVVNVHLRGTLNHTGSEESDPCLVAPLQTFLGEEPDTLVVLGDFTALHHLFKGGQDSAWIGYRALFPINTSTSAAVPNNAQAAILHDNVFLNRGGQNQYTGVCGVVRQGLTHLAIPNGWTWGGPASEHCPVWCEFYLDLRANSSPIIEEEVSKS